MTSHTERTIKYYTPLQQARVRRKIRKAQRKSKKAVQELVQTLVGNADNTEDAIRRAYNMVDINGDNEIQLKEFMSAMRDHLGLKYTNRQLKEFFFDIDVDDDGGVSYDEFASLVTNIAEF